MSDRNALFARRQRRTRYALRQAAGGRPRLSVFRSGKHIYAQVIDDRKGLTLAAASSLSSKLNPYGGDHNKVTFCCSTGKIRHIRIATRSLT